MRSQLVSLLLLLLLSSLWTGERTRPPNPLPESSLTVKIDSGACVNRELTTLRIRGLRFTAICVPDGFPERHWQRRAAGQVPAADLASLLQLLARLDFWHRPDGCSTMGMPILDLNLCEGGRQRLLRVGTFDPEDDQSGCAERVRRQLGALHFGLDAGSDPRVLEPFRNWRDAAVESAWIWR